MTVEHYLLGTTTAFKTDTIPDQVVGSSYTATPETTYQEKNLTFNSYDPEQPVTINVSGNIIKIYYTLPLTIEAKTDSKEYDGSPLTGAYTKKSDGALANDVNGIENMLPAPVSITNVGSVTYPEATLKNAIEAAYPYYVQEDQFGNWLNMDGTPNVYFNTWKDYEGGTGGNTYEIKVADTDFDQTDAVAMLDDYFNGPTAFANAIAQLEKYPYGTGLNHYSLVVENNDYTTQATTIISNLKEQGYSKGNLSTAQMLLDGTSINIPTTGAFYRFKSNATSKYIGFAESGKQPMVNAENACIYFYTASKQFLSYNKGRYLSGGTGNPAATIGTGGAAFNFYESNYSSKTFGTYRIRVADDSYGSLIDWIDDYLNGWGAGDNARCEWTIEAVDELPITMNVVNNKYYGTINLPVAVTIPEGVYAYKAAVAGDVMTLTKVVENGVRVLAANTPVVLYSASEVTSLAISAEAGTGADDDAFSGTTAAITAPEGTNYVLSYSPTEGVGFYKYTGSVIPGFKAYFNDPSGSSVKGFSFSMEDVETAIRAIESENNGIEIYDIAGRRVPQAQKGLYIVNGKKVMFK